MEGQPSFVALSRHEDVSALAPKASVLLQRRPQPYTWASKPIRTGVELALWTHRTRTFETRHTDLNSEDISPSWLCSWDSEHAMATAVLCWGCVARMDVCSMSSTCVVQVPRALLVVRVRVVRVCVVRVRVVHVCAPCAWSVYVWYVCSMSSTCVMCVACPACLWSACVWMWAAQLPPECSAGSAST